MPKYLLRASLTAEGARGTLKEGGTARQAVVEGAVRGQGGTVEAFYYAFGDEDVYVIADLPDDASAAAVSLTVSASGAVRTSTTVLMTPEQVDEASKKSVEYRAPGA
ncbi:MAG: GYD domain-containing protein [Actinomycetota bacterium]|nr:GYD domain-containing protein [Actinomycetota bacterium]